MGHMTFSGGDTEVQSSRRWARLSISLLLTRLLWCACEWHLLFYGMNLDFAMMNTILESKADEKVIVANKVKCFSVLMLKEEAG